ncbi:MAG: MBL fold metallo-hydrolase [Oscillospiraceae bacterium]|nr:MBL fold metallo-hydrolase [Oscillospiraceae bacterium]
MVIRKIEVGPMGVNCYVVSTNSDNAIVFDPGYDTQKILDYINSNNLKVKMIMLTHGHFDHIWELAQFKEKTGAPIYIHKCDADMLFDSYKNVADFFGIGGFKPTKADVLLNGGDVITLDEITCDVIHTPGHSQGSVCYVLDDIIVSGDTLFAGSIGRTDMYGADFNSLLKSLGMLKNLKGDYMVYPGHGPKTTLEREINTNPYMKDLNYDNLF